MLIEVFSVFSLPDYDKEFIIRTDASRKGIGGVFTKG